MATRTLALAAHSAYILVMLDGRQSRSEILDTLRQHEADLRAYGVETMTLFGSHARGDATGVSDVDLAIRPSAHFSSGGFDHFGKLETLRQQLSLLLGRNVDLVEEPVIRPRLKHLITEEGVRAF